MNKKIVLTDADTIIYQAAAVIQQTQLEIEHKISRRKKTFRNITEFKEFLKSDKGRGYHIDDFNIVKQPELTEDISHGLHIIKQKIEMIGNQPFCDSLKLFVGGKGNFRKDIAPYYKSSRPVEKPLAFKDCYQYAVNKYRDILSVCDGEEAEDGVTILGWEGYKIARAAKDQNANPYLLSFCDKDVKQCPGYHWNYDKPTEPVVWSTDIQSARHFWWQMAKGDPTDDIRGLEDAADSTRELYNLGWRKGVGDATANKILEGCKTEKEMAQRVAEAYKAYYKDSWQQQFNENGILLRLRSFEGEMFCATDYIQKLGAAL